LDKNELCRIAEVKFWIFPNPFPFAEFVFVRLFVFGFCYAINCIASTRYTDKNMYF